MENYDVDPEILESFVDESLEGLESLDSYFIDLEKNPENTEIINSIFRPVHSIKGSSAFFGLLKVKSLAHHMEDLLDKIRQKKKFADPQTIKLLLASLDFLRNILENVRINQTESVDDQKLEDFNSRLVEALEEDDGGEVARAAVLIGDLIYKLEEIRDLDPGKMQKHVDEAEGIISGITPIALKGLIKQSENQDGRGDKTTGPVAELAELLRIPFEELEKDAEIVQEIRNQLVKLKNAAVSGETEKLVSEALSEYDAFMQNIGFDEILRDSLNDKVEELAEKGDFVKKETEQDEGQDDQVKEPSESDIQPEEKSQNSRKDVKDKTMRVYEKDIDSFLSFVSELVVVEEMFNYLHKKISLKDSSTASEFKRVIETFGTLSSDLRKSIFSIRMVSVKSLFGKAERIVHDVTSEKDKKAEVVIKGDNLLIDKSYLELLDAPFTHMIRNAADHGIEPPEERKTLGKSETGTVEAEMKETERSVELIIKDDGRGIDYEAVSAKAAEMGIINPGEYVDNDSLTEFLFMSGVSTAEEVTEISGRGVGMDVVKSNIEEAGGSIKISTEKNKGSTFTISLPKNVTTRIIEGFLVKSGEDIYVMPIDIVGESFAVYPGDIETVEGDKGRILRRKETLYGFIRLKDSFYSPGVENLDLKDTSEQKESVEIGISVNIKNSLYVIAVDQILGVQEVVVRDVKGLISENNLFEGASILGDGSVAMILGKEGIEKLLK
ncbi:MAG: chemotaxis protein CheA [Thermodesulfobacteriota bacterium]